MFAHVGVRKRVHLVTDFFNFNLTIAFVTQQNHEE